MNMTLNKNKCVHIIYVKTDIVNIFLPSVSHYIDEIFA